MIFIETHSFRSAPQDGNEFNQRVRNDGVVSQILTQSVFEMSPPRALMGIAILVIKILC